MKIIHYYPSEISVEISQKVCDHFPWWWVMVFHSDYIMVTNGDIIKYQTLISLLFNHYYLWFNITITHLYIYIIIHILHSKNIPKISLRYHKHIPKILYHQDIMNDIPKISLRYWYWLVVLTILKNTSQWEGLSHILWKCLKPPTSILTYTTKKWALISWYDACHVYLKTHFWWVRYQTYSNSWTSAHPRSKGANLKILPGGFNPHVFAAVTSS